MEITPFSPGWVSRLVEGLQPLSIRADRLGSIELFAGLPRADLECVRGWASAVPRADSRPVDPPAAFRDQRIEASSEAAELGGSFSRALISLRR
jgi:hypothetical protein